MPSSTSPITARYGRATALTVSSRPGETWEKTGRRGGRLRFVETITEYRDEDGELVVTARGVGVVPEKAVEGGES